MALKVKVRQMDRKKSREDRAMWGTNGSEEDQEKGVTSEENRLGTRDEQKEEEKEQQMLLTDAARNHNMLTAEQRCGRWMSRQEMRGEKRKMTL